MPTVVDNLYADSQSLLAFLIDRQEPSFHRFVDDISRKVLALSAASLFEERVINMLLDFVRSKSNGDEAIVTLLRRKGIDGQYFKLFDWDKKNGYNTFFNLFGETMSLEFKADLQNDPALKRSADSFLELGNLRNCLVHQNFANYAFEKSAAEVHQLYTDANRFIDYLQTKFPSSIPVAPAS